MLSARDISRVNSSSIALKKSCSLFPTLLQTFCSPEAFCESPPSFSGVRASALCESETFLPERLLFPFAGS